MLTHAAKQRSSHLHYNSPKQSITVVIRKCKW